MHLTSIASVPAFLVLISLGSWAHAQAAEERAAPDTVPPASVLPQAPPIEAAPTPASPASPAAPAAPSTAVPTPAVPDVPAATPSTPAPRAELAASEALAPHEKYATRKLGARHQGFYLRLGGGPSLLSLDGNGPTGRDAYARGAGGSGFVAIGAAVAPGLVLAGTLQGAGLEANFKGGPLEGATTTVNGRTRAATRKATGGFGMVGLLLDWYPKPTGGWHAGVATGLGVVALENSADDSELAGVNLAGSVFGGYDWAMARNWSIGLQLTASGGSKTHMKEEDDNHDGHHDSGYRLTPLAIGLQASLLYF